MTRPTLHICIATGQNLANLIPAVQLQAEEVVILETSDMRFSAENLKTALKARGIKVRRLAFDDSTWKPSCTPPSKLRWSSENNRWYSMPPAATN